MLSAGSMSATDDTGTGASLVNTPPFISPVPAWCLFTRLTPSSPRQRSPARHVHAHNTFHQHHVAIAQHLLDDATSAFALATDNLHCVAAQHTPALKGRHGVSLPRAPDVLHGRPHTCEDFLAAAAPPEGADSFHRRSLATKQRSARVHACLEGSRSSFEPWASRTCSACVKRCRPQPSSSSSRHQRRVRSLPMRLLRGPCLPSPPPTTITCALGGGARGCWLLTHTHTRAQLLRREQRHLLAAGPHQE